MAIIRITEFTDPGCPFAWSAEPFRRKLEWRYGDQIAWRLRMVVLADRREDYEDEVTAVCAFSARSHCSGPVARKPLSLSRTISALTPTGEATTGKPQAIYWMSLYPLLPR